MAGRPRKCRSVKKMQALADEYFAGCEGRAATDAEGYAVTDKRGDPVLIGAHPPTVTGLARALGFASRQSLLDYADLPGFEAVIRDAKMRIEEYLEAALLEGPKAAGAKFSLINSFEGWKPERLAVVTDPEGGVGLLFAAPVERFDAPEEIGDG
jgi:hypothetical protein